MPAITVKSVARNVAARCQGNVSFDISILEGLLERVINAIFGRCFGDGETDPVQLSESVKHQNESNPTRLLRKTTVAVRRDARPQRVKQDEAAYVAKELIAEACESTAARFASVYRAVNG